MAKTLAEYADWLDERKLTWPAPPKRVPVAAKPSFAMVDGIRAVTFSVYGTLLRITDGQLLFVHPQAMRMEIALERTIKEFNMWNSMTRKPGAPSAALMLRYQRVLDEQQLATGRAPGDIPELDAVRLWMKLVRQLQQKEYSYSETTLGNLEELSEKIAFFFHSCLQGVEAEEEALDTLRVLPQAGTRLGLLADGQRFTKLQILRALKRQGTLRSLDEVFEPALETLSFQEGIRKPSKLLFRRALDRFRSIGIAPAEVLHVGTRLRDDLAVAKLAGMRTALLAADQTSLAATKAEISDPELRPDRLITRLSQIRDLVGI